MLWEARAEFKHFLYVLFYAQDRRFAACANRLGTQSLGGSNVGTLARLLLAGPRDWGGDPNVGRWSDRAHLGEYCQ